MTITHEVARDEVMAYLDGELPVARAVAVRDHLDRCAECRALADDLRGVSAGLADWQVESAPDRLVAPAGAPSDRSSAGRGWKVWLLAPSFLGVSRWAIAAAGATAGLALVVLANRQFVGRPAAIDMGRPVDVLSGLQNENGALASPAPAATDDRLRSLGYVSAGRGGAGKTRGPNNAPVARDPSQIVGMTLGQAVQTGGADASQPMVVRTASVSLSTETFDDLRPALERVAAAHHGSVAALTLAGDPPNRRTLNATVRVPVAEMDATLAGVRALGRVVQESQNTEDVTDAHRDLAIRIANAKVEEAR
ncbi:MAG TPA: DUF4349 domain-containing protein, partial [Vicinamibacterales bacterium]|nr:DUF4349 domain-containing protein [Vicinamibacterales bacterium]